MPGFFLTQVRNIARCLAGALVVCLFSASLVQAAEDSTSLVNAFFLQSIPERYRDMEKIFPLLKAGGADTVIARPPRKNGDIDTAALTNLTFLSHQAGLRIYVVLPTRLDNSALKIHPEWEDIRYDLGNGSLQATGNLDLANPQVLAYLLKRFKEVAAFSVDGILLDQDFRYESTEGLSASILGNYDRKYGSRFAVRKAFAKVSPAMTEAERGTLDKSFWQWSELKRDALVNAAQELGKSCRSVYGEIKFGLPLPVPGGETPQEALARFAFDMDAFRKLAIDFYWFELRPVEDEAQGGRSYKKNLEQYSRLVKSACAMQKDPAKMIVAIPTGVSGKVLPLFEIEETTALAEQAGETGIAYIVQQAALPPPQLTIKLFRRK